jgi:hypothetical protein
MPDVENITANSTPQNDVFVTANAGDLVGAGAESTGANGLAVKCYAFDLLQIEKGAQGMAALA